MTPPQEQWVLDNASFVAGVIATIGVLGALGLCLSVLLGFIDFDKKN